ncbi:MAG TPA: hypothetical protein DCW68_02070 [Rhodospirillaceae bacterium]|nr:MAG: hypothetical protein A2018_05035 [Alphaproteobacteria bacterium GWF2_58_20]HAU28881.1 hypothetical protein [Rhodospirillaceae bacterium]
MKNKILPALALSLIMATPALAQTSGLTAHEWGLWHLSGNLAETMPQVQETLPPHVNNTLITIDDFGWPSFGNRPDGMIVRKPVVWFYGAEGTALTYKVNLSGNSRIIANFPSLDGSLGEPGTAVWNLTLGEKDFAEPEQEKGMSPWYGKLYLPEANSVSFKERNETEGFLFYEASVLHELPISRNESGVTLDEDMPLVVSILNMPGQGVSVQFNHNVAKGDYPFPQDMGKTDIESATATLSKALEDMGLFKAEAEAFTSVWQPELFELGGRVLVILPQETYNRLLPATITPKPERFIRIGAIMTEVP